MGWSFGYDSKEDLVARMRANAAEVSRYKILKDAVAGNNFWMLHQDTENPSHVFISVIKMDSGMENGRLVWGYKHINESSFPDVTLNCPRSMLLASTEPKADWREYALLVDENKRAAKSLVHPGLRLEMRDAKSYVLKEDLGTKGWVVSCNEEDGKRYRMPVKHIKVGLERIQLKLAQDAYEALVQDGTLLTPLHWRDDQTDAPLPFDRLPEAAKALFVNRAIGGSVWPTVRSMLEEDEGHPMNHGRRMREHG